MIAPYRSTPVFDEKTLPEALKREHRTKDGVWGVIRVLEGKLKFVLAESGTETILTPDRPGLVQPQQTHRVEPLSKLRMQIDFYDREPALDPAEPD
jgi:tellurite resistance-related uncharacterized protein